ncbi:endonuclease MutS2 [Tuanshanicoccus lijuaniae]|uniref:endonuclease MutS2 n=1 Tax=Aerococcaceae bacterium zg-1292 TaxID=2774330 RepID=UPI001936FCC4|nr:endonuclease MutS2 [Aerococcaceae bacterium zg-1292]QQA36675.1 endonuclease MutS2 [Aerococcaceae bacterium zg-1292]
MSNNQKIYETLEFGKVQQQILHFIQTDLGKEKILAMRILNEREKLQQLQSETEQSLAILLQQKQMPIPRLANLNRALQRLKLEATLNGMEIAQIGRLLSTTKQLIQFFDQLAKEEKHFPALTYWVNQCVHLPQVEQMIIQSVADDGSILSTASTQLASIRRQQTQTDAQIRNQLNQLVKSKASQLSDTLITMRNDVYVLPVKAEYRHQFGGRVHDQSSTGQTLYIEPQAVTALNQKRAELIVAERKEIERILAEISVALMPHYAELMHNQEMVAELDFIQARGEHARAYQAVRPKFSDDNHVALWQVRHPLIDAKQIVANDLIIGEEYRALIITGPNTGGKTILLKTLGLLQMMAQTGLHIPADKGSQVGIFDDIFADIGDEQSIEQSLSTFSSHMTNTIRILEQATHQSLLLFDELGSGTDPQEGASLAMAILNYLHKLDATVMATTHYPELKLYAHDTPKTINASMEFDSATLSPTYRLLIGVPGRSNAFDISQRLGLRADILEEARSGIDTDTQSVNEMVANLERERREAELAHEEALEQLALAEKLHKDLRTEYNRWLEQKNELVEKAKRQANEQVEEAKGQAEKILQEIRDLQLEQGARGTIKEHVLIDKRNAFDQLKQPENLKKNKILKRAREKRRYKVGDDVEVLTYGQRGTIVEQVGAEKYIVQMGILKMKLASEELSPLEKVDPKTKVNVQRQAGSKVQTTLDLRGERYEQALYRLRQYLDAALLSNHPMVTIIHGKGTGALRDGVKKVLSQHSQVDHFEYSAPNAGGDGSTVVYFK